MADFSAASSQVKLLRFYPSSSEFIGLATRNALIPIVASFQADFETPVSLFANLASRPYSFLLESAQGPQQLTRYSFIVTEPTAVFYSVDGRCYLQEKESTRKLDGNPFDLLRQVLSEFRQLPIHGLPPFSGGAVGFIGYDAARFLEKLPSPAVDDLGLPDMVFGLYDTVAVYDHQHHALQLLKNVKVWGNATQAYKLAVKEIEDFAHELLGHRRRFQNPIDKTDHYLPTVDQAIHTPITCQSSWPPTSDRAIHPTASKQSSYHPTGDQLNCPLTSNQPGERSCSRSPKQFLENSSAAWGQDKFIHAVNESLRLIREGELLQVVLSERWSCETTAQPFEIYRCLRALNPSPYMFYLNFGDFKVLGASPEMLVKRQGDTVKTHPIAGTRPRYAIDSQDKALEQELLQDPKERAEHAMLVDLARNDLGRVCKFGTVTVTKFMAIEHFSHVMHLVSEVEGKLHPDFDSIDVLKATFPAGTVSGAPKIRAMQAIAELEPTKRGPYAGIVGYISFSGNMDTCITIRSIVMCGNVAHISAGAGIVADSKPENEYQECKNKALAAASAILGAEQETFIPAGKFHAMHQDLSAEPET